MTLRADLSGQRALVTGASSGFGAHFARVLADAGAEVILAAWRTQALDSLAADITARGGAARSIALDVGDNGSVVAAVVAACEIDILINNAGVTNTKPVLEQTEADWDFVVGTNLNGAWLVATEVARAIKAGGGGSIINIASILGVRQGGQVSPYAISKAGVLQLTKQLALELARYRIRVNALVPGYWTAPTSPSALLSRVFTKSCSLRSKAGKTFPSWRTSGIASERCLHSAAVFGSARPVTFTSMLPKE